MTPHEKLFNFSRKSTSGQSIPTWVKPGPIYIRQSPKHNKGEPPVTEATLLHSNPLYAHVRLPSGKETSINIRDIAPHPNNCVYTENSVGEADTCNTDDTNSTPVTPSTDIVISENNSGTNGDNNSQGDAVPDTDLTNANVRRSTREKRAPKYLEEFKVG